MPRFMNVWSRVLLPRACIALGIAAIVVSAYWLYGLLLSKQIKPLSLHLNQVLEEFKQSHPIAAGRQPRLASPPGAITGCSVLMLESLWRDCAAVVVSHDEDLPPEWIDSLRVVLEDPCKFAALPSVKLRQAASFFGCHGVPRGFSVHVFVQRVETEILSNGQARARVTVLDDFRIKVD
jgi:hypothetical protein